jgi:hypothetical protein
MSLKIFKKIRWLLKNIAAKNEFKGFKTKSVILSIFIGIECLNNPQMCNLRILQMMETNNLKRAYGE